MLVDRADVEGLERQLCESDTLRRALDAACKQHIRDADEWKQHHRLEVHSLRMTRDALQDEVISLQQRLEETELERNDLLSTIEPLEFELKCLRKQMEASRSGSSGAVRDAQHSWNNDDALTSRVLREGAGALTPPSSSEENGVLSTSGLSREQQLLRVVEHSATIFLSLDQEIHAAQAELNSLRAEKQHWLTNEYELHAAISRLENEREQYIAREVERSSGVIVAVHALSTEEHRERKLLETQAEAELFGLAYQRCRNDSTVIAKQLTAKVELIIAERQRALRAAEIDMKLHLERVQVDMQSAHAKNISDMERKMEEIRLAKQKVELQNSMLKANCDEWRSHSEKRDRDHQDAFERFRQEASNQVSARDAAIKEREAAIAALHRERDALQLSNKEFSMKVRTLQSKLDQLESERAFQTQNVRHEGAQTEGMETMDEMKVRVIREIEAEDEMFFARRVTAHPLFLKLQDVVAKLRQDAVAKEEELVSLTTALNESVLQRQRSEHNAACELKRVQDDMELLRAERDAVVQQCNVSQRQREVAEREVKQCLGNVEMLQAETQRYQRELQDMSKSRDEAERKWRETLASMDQCTQQLGVEMQLCSEKTNALDQITHCVSRLQHEVYPLRLSLVEAEETIARLKMEHMMDSIVSRLASIGAVLLADGSGVDGDEDDDAVVV